jgi:DNA-binding transcriptional LysR family regulator
MIITTERLRYLVTVAEQGSFSSAARLLGVSNSAVNKTIQSLEEDLELSLFVRQHGKRPTLTDAGKAMYFQGLDILPKLIRMEQHALTLSQGIESSLNIVVHPYTLYPQYSQLFRQLTERFPDVELNFIDGESLSSYEDDFNILIGPTKHHLPRGIEFATIDELEWRMVCAATHPLAAKSGWLELEDLEQHPQLLLTEGFNTSAEYREAMRYSPQLINVDRFYQFRELLLEGVGFALYPAQLAKPLCQAGALVDLAFDFGPIGNRWPIEMLWRKQLGKAGEWLVEQLLSMPAARSSELT